MHSDGPTRLLVFGVGSERFAVPLAAVDEVVDAPVLRRLPDASRVVLGVTSVRGELVTVYDPRPVLDVDGAVRDAALVFRRASGRVGLAVDALHDPIVVEPQDLRPVPASAGDRALLGLVRRGTDLIAVLDADALLDAAAAMAENGRERT